MGLQKRNFDLATGVAAAIRVCRLRRPRQPFRLNDLVALIEEDQNHEGEITSSRRKPGSR
jgi:hypothetical protein